MRPLVVLISDDEAAARWTREALAPDLEVITTGSMAQAISTIADREPGLVLLDVAMPVVRGTDIVNMVRRECINVGAALYFYSALDEDQLLVMATQHHAQGYLRRDGDRERLRKAVASICRVTLGSAAQASGRSAGGLRVWVIGLGAAEASVLRALRDARVERLGSAKELSTRLDRETPSLLILGEQLSGGSVKDVAQRVRQREPPTRNVPILFIHDSPSAMAERGDVPGVSRLLERDFDMAELQDMVRILMSVAPRRSARIMVRIHPMRDAGGRRILGFTRNVSKSGMLAVCSQPLEVGVPVRLSFRLPRHDTDLELAAQVVRAHPQADEPNAFGLRFDAVPEQVARVLAEFVALGAGADYRPGAER